MALRHRCKVVLLTLTPPFPSYLLSISRNRVQLHSAPKRHENNIRIMIDDRRTRFRGMLARMKLIFGSRWVALSYGRNQHKTAGVNGLHGARMERFSALGSFLRARDVRRLKWGSRKSGSLINNKTASHHHHHQPKATHRIVLISRHRHSFDCECMLDLLIIGRGCFADWLVSRSLRGQSSGRRFL